MNEQVPNVMVEIYDDRIEICNPGGLPKGLSPEEFRQEKRAAKSEDSRNAASGGLHREDGNRCPEDAAASSTEKVLEARSEALAG